MRKYYLFNIKNDFYDLYINNSYVLYSTLKNIHNLKKPYLNYGLSLYDQLCNTFNVEVLSNYISNKYNTNYKHRFLLKNKKSKEKVLININYSTVSIISTNNYSPIFNIFYLYNKKIFVCDFENNDYFWIEDVYKHKHNHIINYNT